MMSVVEVPSGMFVILLIQENSACISVVLCTVGGANFEAQYFRTTQISNRNV